MSIFSLREEPVPCTLDGIDKEGIDWTPIVKDPTASLALDHYSMLNKKGCGHRPTSNNKKEKSLAMASHEPVDDDLPRYKHS